MKFETHTLQNGMRVILAPSKSAETVTVMIMTATGSRYETKEENGMAHFLEHMVFKGTKKRPTAQKITQEIDGVGGQMNAFTGKDRTAYYVKVGKPHFAKAFDVIADVFLNPTLPKKEIEKERGAVIEEINMYEDMPMRSVLDEADKTLFGDAHPLGRPILGPKENIQTFQRNDFTTYFTRNYVAENSAICIAGAFSKTDALNRARRMFAQMRTGPKPPCTPYVHDQHEPRVHIKNKSTDQSHFILAVPSYQLGNANEPVAEVLAAILGGGMSSRLFSEIREHRGLAYYIRAEQEGYADTGVLYVRAGVGNEKLEDAVKITVGELRKITKTKVGAAELKKAKEYVKGAAALSLDTTDAQAEYIGHMVLVKGVETGLDVFNKAVDAVTASQIQRVARELLKTEHLNLTVVGPHANEAQLVRLLKI